MRAPRLRRRRKEAQLSEAQVIFNTHAVQRVAFLGYNTAGCWTALQIGFERRKIQSTIFGNKDHPFRYGNSIENYPVPLARLLFFSAQVVGTGIRWAERHSLPRIHTALRYASYFAKSAANAVLARHLGRYYDVVFLEEGTGLAFHPRNQRLLQRHGCRVAFVAFGSDFRPAFLNGARFPLGSNFESRLSWTKMHGLTASQAEHAFSLENSGFSIIAFPGGAHFFGKPIVDRELLGFPTVPIRHRVMSVSTHKIRIVHAPSNPRVKGSDVVRRVAESLTQEYASVEFDFVTGVSRDEAMERLAQAHLVVDQMYSDQYAGVLAREALALGIPVVIGSYDSEWLSSHYRNRMPEGIYLIHPDQLHETLVGLLSNWKDLAQRRRQRAQNFASTDGLDLVADRWLRAALGDRDPSFMFDPRSLDVPLGGFGPIAHLRSLIHGYVELFGEEALHLDDKIQLKQAVLRRGGLE